MRRPGPLQVAVLVGVLVAVVVGGVALRGGDDASLPVQSGAPPWPPVVVDLADRLDAIHVPFSDMEGTALHIHPLLAIIVEGARITVPADIGIDPSTQTMAALHTHDSAGTIHVESPVVRKYTLGEFFDVWGVRLTTSCVGGFCDDGAKHVVALVDGVRVRGDIRSIELRDRMRILVAYGTERELAGLG